MARGPEISVTGCLTANLDGSSYALTPTPETAAGSAPAAAATPTTPTASIFATFAYTVNFNQPANGTLTVSRAGSTNTSPPPAQAANW